ncbi:hypothetical protein KEM52_002172 [Ascosphaera acerosa]|nr:hypothetical protein KEM52_002172 [Ascosphaera acerosa]
MSQKQPACSADAGVVATDVGSDAISSKHVGQGNVTPTAKHAKRLTLQFPIVISDSVAASYALQTDVGCGSRQRPSTNSTRRAGLTLERRSTDPGSRDSSERSNEPRVEGGDQSSDAAMFFRQANAAKADDTADPSLTSPQALENEDAVDGGTAFLTALAAQERKVLELREELHKAEAELTSLKKHWAASEHFKKDSELRFQTEAMKFMKRPSLSSHPADTPLPEQQHGQGTGLLRRQSISVAPTPSDRRPSIARHSHSPSLASTASASPRTSKPRTVFQGSKHTRTLSLLANRNSSISLPQPDQFRLSGMRSNSSIDHPPRSLTLPSIDVTKQSLLSPTAQAPHSQRSPTAARDQTRSEGAALRRALAGHPAAESLVRTGQQMAADLKDNLWTFIEDIRQAAVGEELSRPVPRPNNGATSTSALQSTA